MRYFHPTPPLLCRRSPAPFTAKASALALACALALGGCATEPGTGTPAAQPPAAPAAPAVPPPAQAVPATPAAADGHEEGFVQWRNAFVAQALAEGIRPDTVRNVLAQAQWQPLVIELDRSQPEFTRTPWAYLDSAVSPLRVSQGLAKLEQHSTPLQAAAERYGVPASVVTAIWGIESNYGSNFGTFKTVDALATLAYEGRRHDWARSQLLAALHIIDRGDIAAEAMIGSWAGAMGHTQFIPTVFQAYAVDADGDGRRDIWGSIPDVAASTAHFLVREGWVPGETWGTEVQLPAGFDHARAELSVRQSTAQWAAEGVRSMDGNALPDLASASILAPAGARGPAFLVGKNFRTILRYNNSTNYALAVALLSQRLSGGPGLVAEWPRDLQPLSREQTRQLQTALNAKGFDTGTPDGVLGPATRAGLRKYQQSQGLVADGYPTLELLRSLAPAGTNP